MAYALRAQFTSYVAVQFGALVQRLLQRQLSADKAVGAE